MIPDAVLKVWHEKRVENGLLEGFPLGIAWALENLVKKKIGPKTLFWAIRDSRDGRGAFFTPLC